MKSAGETSPRSGWCPPQQRFEARDFVALEVQLRLIIELELTCVQGSSQIPLELAPRLHALIHFALEEARAAGRVHLGAIECEIGVLQELVGVAAVAGANRNANADADDNLVVVEIERRGKYALDLAGERRRGCSWFIGRLHDDELVSTDARDHLDALEPARQPLRHPLQELISHRWPERVVHLFEAVDIEQKHHQRGFPVDLTLDRCPDKGVQLRSIGQIGQRVVARHVLHLRLYTPQLRDVLVRRDPAALRHRLVHHGDGAAIAQLLHLGIPLHLARGSEALVEVVPPFSPTQRPLAMRASMILRNGVPGVASSLSSPYISM
jgi:hypothetical protein